MSPSNSRDASNSSPQIEPSAERAALVPTTANDHGLQEPQQPLRIDTVPVEIWADIFKRSCASFLQIHKPPFQQPGGKPKHHYDSLLPSNPVLVISRVCVAWRDIIQSLPDMWSRVLLKESCLEKPSSQAIPSSSVQPSKIVSGADDASASSRTTRLRILADHLRFSGIRPLHIIFHLPSSTSFGFEGITSKHFIDQVTSSVVLHHHRWGRIDIHDCEEGWTLMALKASISQHSITELSSLEELTFSWNAMGDDGPFSEPPIEFPICFKNAPKLRVASFHYRCPYVDEMPWTQLKRVTFDGVFREELFDVLPYLTSVTDLTIHWGDSYILLDPEEYEEYGHPFPEIRNFTLPSLKKLSIIGCLEGAYAWEDPCFRDVANFPNLRTLSLDTVRSEDLLSINAFLKRSGCQLLEFSCALYKGHSTRCVEALCMLLTSTPHLQALDALQSLSNTPQNSDEPEEGLPTLLRFLLRRDGARIINCPDLQRLRIDPSCFTDPALLPTTIDMIEMRWATGRANAPEKGEVSGLQSVGCVDRYQWEHHFEGNDGIPELYERLKSLHLEGLSVCFSESPSVSTSAVVPPSASIYLPCN